jgi:cationic peptide transport system substrate-binding protein
MMTIKHFSVHRCIFLFIITCLFGCEFDDEATNTLANNSVIYCSEGAPEAFNPQIVTSGTTIDTVSKQLYNRLLDFDSEDNSLIPSLATDWHVTKDGKMITFYLRRDVSFHHTKYFKPSRQLNADDVLFTFNRILDENHPFHWVSGGNYPFFQNGRFQSLIQRIEKINDYTVRFVLNYPDSSFLTKLATDYAAILSAEYGQQLQRKQQKYQIDYLPVGTGPYYFDSYRSGSYVRFKRNPHYWQHPVAIEQLIFDISPRNTNRLTKLLTHECDVIAYPIARNKIIERPELTLDAVTSFNIGYLGFNTQKPPFNNVLVRQAIAHAINRQSIIHLIYGDDATLATSLLPENSWAKNNQVTLPEYDVEKAKQLLKQAGFEQGFKMNIWAMPIQRAYNPNALKMAKLIQADLAEINITASIVSFEWNTFLRRLSQGEHDSFLLGWSADHPDPDNFLTPLLSCASAARGNNRTFWCHSEFENLIASALTTTNLVERKKYYQRALAILNEQLPLIPLAHSKRYQARNNRIKGQLLHSFGGIDFSSVQKIPEQEQ